MLDLLNHEINKMEFMLNFNNLANNKNNKDEAKEVSGLNLTLINKQKIDELDKRTKEEIYCKLKDKYISRNNTYSIIKKLAFANNVSLKNNLAVSFSRTTKEDLITKSTHSFKLKAFQSSSAYVILQDELKRQILVYQNVFKNKHSLIFFSLNENKQKQEFVFDYFKDIIYYKSVVNLKTEMCDYVFVTCVDNKYCYAFGLNEEKDAFEVLWKVDTNYENLIVVGSPCESGSNNFNDNKRGFENYLFGSVYFLENNLVFYKKNNSCEFKVFRFEDHSINKQNGSRHDENRRFTFNPIENDVFSEGNKDEDKFFRGSCTYLYSINPNNSNINICKESNSNTSAKNNNKAKNNTNNKSKKNTILDDDDFILIESALEETNNLFPLYDKEIKQGVIVKTTKSKIEVIKLEKDYTVLKKFYYYSNSRINSVLLINKNSFVYNYDSNCNSHTINKNILNNNLTTREYSDDKRLLYCSDDNHSLLIYDYDTCAIIKEINNCCKFISYFTETHIIGLSSSLILNKTNSNSNNFNKKAKGNKNSKKTKAPVESNKSKLVLFDLLGNTISKEYDIDYNEEFSPIFQIIHFNYDHDKFIKMQYIKGSYISKVMERNKEIITNKSILAIRGNNKLEFYDIGL